MPRSRRSFASPPEFFADRCLGRAAPRLLVEWAGRCTCSGITFPDDGQAVGDPEWMDHGLSRGWSLLTQDVRIAYQPVARALLQRHRGVIHCLSSAELPARVRAERFHSRQRVIYQHAVDRRVGFYVVQETGPPRKKRL